MLQAKLMDLDALTDPSSSEPLSERFWRRYAESAFGLLERIREDESSAALLIENAEYTRCEIELAARREMIVTARGLYASSVQNRAGCAPRRYRRCTGSAVRPVTFYSGSNLQCVCSEYLNPGI